MDTMVQVKLTQAEKFRRMAETLAEQIATKRGPRLENTPKRQREGMSARLDADNMERVQRALLALADAHENGTCPPEFAGFKTKKDIEPLVTKFSESRSYYVVGPGDYRDSSPLAVKLRGFVEAWADRFKEQDRARLRAEHVKELENAVRFADIPGFFPTPPELVAAMIEQAELVKGYRLLEPSAGKGDIAEAARAAGAEVGCIERNYNLCDILRDKGFHPVCADFMEIEPSPQYGRVVMNPPFENRQDLEHVRRAFDWLCPGGRLVALVSAGSFFGQQSKCAEFRAWLEGVDHEWQENDPDAFRAAFKQTGCRTVMLTINKK